MLGDRVKEVTTTTGTTNFELLGPQAGFQSFIDGIERENGQASPRSYADIPYACHHYNLAGDLLDVEIGRGTATAGAGSANAQLSRDTIVYSTNGGYGGAKVSFAAGTKILTLSPQGADVGVGSSAWVLEKSSSDQTVGTTPTKLTWETTTVDVGDITVSLANNRVTVLEAGTWLCGVAAYCKNTDGTDEDLLLHIYKNGAVQKDARVIDVVAGQYASVGGSFELTLAVNDYIEAYASHHAGTHNTVYSDDDQSGAEQGPGARFWGLKI